MICAYCNAEMVRRPDEWASIFKRRRFCDVKCYNDSRGRDETEPMQDPTLAQAWRMYDEHIRRTQ